MKQRDLKWWEYPAIFIWVVGGSALFFGAMWTAVNGPLWASITVIVLGFGISFLGQAQIAAYKADFERDLNK